MIEIVFQIWIIGWILIGRPVRILFVPIIRHRFGLEIDRLLLKARATLLFPLAPTQLVFQGVLDDASVGDGVRSGAFQDLHHSLGQFRDFVVHDVLLKLFVIHIL